jgi:hypothetical protein
MKDLRCYQLKGNPFEIVSHVHDMADRKEEWDRIQRVLSSSFEDRLPRFIFLLGEWGEGKSYMLNRIYLWLSGEISPKVFVMKLKTDVLYSRPLGIQESEPRWQKFGLDLITRVLGNISRERWAEVFQGTNLKNLDSFYLKVFQGLKNNSEVAFKFISGERLDKLDLKELGLSAPLTNSPQAINLFFDFLKAIRLAKYNSFLLLLDEFEYIPAVFGEKKITQILNTFREIFDRCGYHPPAQMANPIFLFAVSPGGWDRLKELEESAKKKTGGGGIVPFMERINPRDNIQMKPFAVEDTKELVQLRLAEVRIKKLKDPFFPFTEKSIEYVHELSFNKPRNVIQYCGILLEDACNEGLEKIDMKDAKRILQKYGIVPVESKKS